MTEELNANNRQILNGLDRPKRETHRHLFTVAVYTSVKREVAMENLSKLLDAHNQEIMARGARPDMAVVPDE